MFTLMASDKAHCGPGKEEANYYFASNAHRHGRVALLGDHSRGSEDDAIYNSIKHHQIPKDKSSKRCVRSLQRKL